MVRELVWPQKSKSRFRGRKFEHRSFLFCCELLIPLRCENDSYWSYMYLPVFLTQENGQKSLRLCSTILGKIRKSIWGTSHFLSICACNKLSHMQASNLHLTTRKEKSKGESERKSQIYANGPDRAITSQGITISYTTKYCSIRATCLVKFAKENFVC